jgi:hypothetical protein
MRLRKWRAWLQARLAKHRAHQIAARHWAHRVKPAVLTAWRQQVVWQQRARHLLQLAATNHLRRLLLGWKKAAARQVLLRGRMHLFFKQRLKRLLLAWVDWAAASGRHGRLTEVAGAWQHQQLLRRCWGYWRRPLLGRQLLLRVLRRAVQAWAERIAAGRYVAGELWCWRHPEHALLDEVVEG